MATSSKPSSPKRPSTNRLGLAAVFLPTLLSVVYLKWGMLVTRSTGISPSLTTSMANLHVSSSQVHPAVAIESSSSIPTTEESPSIQVEGYDGAEHGHDEHTSDEHNQEQTTTMIPAGHPQNWIQAMRDQYTHACPPKQYTTRIFSTDPLIIYIDDFITEPERTYLLWAAQDKYSHSGVADPATGAGMQDAEVRSSTSAIIPNEDPIAECIKQRSTRLQGNLPSERVEDVQVVRYQQGQQYKWHYDWYEAQEANPRISTIFAYLACDSGVAGEGECEGGPTQFPEYQGQFEEAWCDVVDCGNGLDGVGFKPIEGNAVFWSNMLPNGSGFHLDTLHAGIPVTAGRKVGLNIWTRRHDFDAWVDF